MYYSVFKILIFLHTSRRKGEDATKKLRLLYDKRSCFSSVADPECFNPNPDPYISTFRI
jgi:hypothetical protein